MKTRTKVLLIAVAFLAVAVVIGLVFGSSGRNDGFQPTDEYRLEPWLSLHLGPVDMSINKAVFYLLLALGLTVATMVFIARRMEAKPNRTQTAVEVAYDVARNNIAGGNMPADLAVKWFPLVGTVFFFIWFSNLIGYLPLPINSAHPVNIFGVDVPALAIYAATANVSVPLVLTLIVFGAYQYEGVRRQGLVRYIRSWIPAGTPGPMKPLIFAIEVISQFVRIISLSVRLFANILSGHLLILFMGGGLAVMLGVAALGWITMPLAIGFFIFEIGLIATLQAFIFATLTSIYFGEATAEGH